MQAMQSWQNLVYVLHLPLQIPLYTQDCFKLFKMSCAYRSRAYLHIRHLSSLPYKNQNNYYKNPPKYDLSLDEKGNNITPLILWNEKGWEPIFQTQKYTCGKQLFPFAAKIRIPLMLWAAVFGFVVSWYDAHSWRWYLSNFYVSLWWGSA